LKSELIKEALNSVGNILLTVGGRSMGPFIPDRSAVVIQRIPPGRVRVGDVAMVWTGKEHFLLHRVLRIRNNGGKYSVLIKGDRHLVHDGWHSGESVAGVVSEIRFPGGLQISGLPLMGLSLAGWMLSCCRLAAGRLSTFLGRR